MDNLYNFEEASKKLRISTQTLRKFIKNNEITYVKIASRKFFTEDDIKKFLENNKIS